MAMRDMLKRMPSMAAKLTGGSPRTPLSSM
jgi:hypothetical protein